METRKIQTVGNKSYSVSVPKSWVQKNHIKEHSTVFVEETGRNSIEISIIKKEHELKELEIRDESINNIKEFIVFCYVKNIERLKIRSKNFDNKRVIDIRSIMRYLEGFDITQEDKNLIEISFLFNDVNVNIPHILRRVLYLLKFMISQLEEKDTEHIGDTEHTTDRLYHLCRRILFSCLNNHALMKSNDIHHAEDIIFYKDLMKRLENIGDKLLELGNEKYETQDIKTAGIMIDALESMILHKTKITDSKKVILGIILPKKYETRQIIHRIRDLSMDVVENYLSIYFNKEYFS